MIFRWEVFCFLALVYSYLLSADSSVTYCFFALVDVNKQPFDKKIKHVQMRIKQRTLQDSLKSTDQLRHRGSEFNIIVRKEESSR